MNRRSSTATLDVSGLAPGAFGYRSILWWGTIGMIAIEGTVFVLVIMVYFFLRSHAATWPMTALPAKSRMMLSYLA